MAVGGGIFGGRDLLEQRSKLVGVVVAELTLGGEPRTAGLDDPPKGQRIQQFAAPSAQIGVGLTRRDRSMIDHGPAATAANGLHHTGCTQGHDRLAQGGPGHPEQRGEFSFRRQGAAVAEDPESDRGGQPFDRIFEGVPAVTGAEQPVGQRQVSRRRIDSGCRSRAHPDTESADVAVCTSFGPCMKFFLPDSCQETKAKINTTTTAIGA